jgi:membrane-bound lytic murein transglycosylase
MRKLALLGLIAATTAACSVGEVDAVAGALGVDLTDAQSLAVANHYNTPDDCYGAVARVWPARLQSWARRIVYRESRNVPTARNASGASGCFQLKLPLHADLFTRVGCRAADWANPMCNTRAAWLLYQGSGATPWGG